MKETVTEYGCSKEDVEDGKESDVVRCLFPRQNPMAHKADQSATCRMFLFHMSSHVYVRGEMDCAHNRSYFYVGGQYVDHGRKSHIMEGQMYVERLTPAAGSTRPFPVVFVHGGGQSGTVSHTGNPPPYAASFSQRIATFPQPRV